jgi:hypothetical protein
MAIDGPSPALAPPDGGHKEMIVMETFRRVLVATSFALLLALGSSAVAQATQENLDAQLATATQHAGFAMDAAELDMAVRHLGHVLNCIAGDGGEGFDGAWGHPCDGQGDGILADVAAHEHGEHLAIVVRSAHALAMEGVQQESLAAVHAAAAGVRALLTVLADFGG